MKIEKSARNEMTGAYRMFVTMINNHDESVYFTFGFWKERNELGDYGVENKSIQKEGITVNKIRVIFSNNKEEYI